MNETHALGISYIPPAPISVELDPNLTNTAKFLYRIITMLAVKTGYCYASCAYLANFCGVTVRTIDRALKTLKDNKLLEVRKKTRHVVHRVPLLPTKKIFIDVGTISGNNIKGSKRRRKKKLTTDKNVVPKTNRRPTKMSDYKNKKKNIINNKEETVRTVSSKGSFHEPYTKDTSKIGKYLDKNKNSTKKSKASRIRKEASSLHTSKKGLDSYVMTDDLKLYFDHWNKQGFTKHNIGTKTYKSIGKSLWRVKRGKLIPGFTEKITYRKFVQALSNFKLAAFDFGYKPYGLAAKKRLQKTGLVDFLYNPYWQDASLLVQYLNTEPETIKRVEPKSKKLAARFKDEWKHFASLNGKPFTPKEEDIVSVVTNKILTFREVFKLGYGTYEIVNDLLVMLSDNWKDRSKLGLSYVASDTSFTKLEAHYRRLKKISDTDNTHWGSDK